MLEFTGSLPAFSSNELASVEEELGRALPASLIDLLKQHNGGNPTRNVFRKGGRSYYFQHLYPISDWKRPNLRDEIRISSYLTRSGFVPFGLEGSGMVFAISDEGCIYACDRGEARILLAQNFAAFFSGLEGERQIVHFTGDDRMNAVANSIAPAALSAYLSEGNPIDAKNSEGLSLAHLCAINGNVSMLTEIAQAGGRLDGALHYAAKFNRREIISFLLKSGRSVLERDDRGLRPVDYVRGNPPLRKYLLELSVSAEKVAES